METKTYWDGSCYILEHKGVKHVLISEEISTPRREKIGEEKAKEEEAEAVKETIARGNFCYEVWIADEVPEVTIEQMRTEADILEGLNQLGMIEDNHWTTDGGWVFMEVSVNFKRKE